MRAFYTKSYTHLLPQEIHETEHVRGIWRSKPCFTIKDLMRFTVCQQGSANHPKGWGVRF